MTVDEYLATGGKITILPPQKTPRKNRRRQYPISKFRCGNFVVFEVVRGIYETQEDLTQSTIYRGQSFRLAKLEARQAAGEIE